jgi:uncharacterized protein YdhG (YjbR/CyaY superfamily)
MSERKGAKRATKTTGTFSDEERAAVRDTVRERKVDWGKNRAEDERVVLAKIAQMPEPDLTLAKQLHEIVKMAAPDLSPRLWYGMPAYTSGGEVLFWFQPAHKFKARYGFIGFSGQAKLDEGRMWPISFAITQLTPVERERIAVLLRKAVG